LLDINKKDLSRHHAPRTFSDRFAFGVVRAMSALASLFGSRYGDRVIVVETIAAVPPMVMATLLHLRCLRRLADDRGWVRTFMDESENQRAHLMAFVALARPNTLERWAIVLGQGVFYNLYFLLGLVSARTAHRIAAYMAERSVSGYTDLLARLATGDETGVEAPASAIAYWNLSPNARISEMVTAIRGDEAIYRDIHHAFADTLAAGNDLPDRPGPLI
jgi:ubiquinol oxidase